MKKIKWIILFSLLFLLLYTRFINLSWGFPYPFHPDERNMANALQQLSCREFSIFNFQFSNIERCFNPNFFAYGQFQIYLGYIIVFFLKFFDGDLGRSISFEGAVFSLRLISATASILTIFFASQILKKVFEVKNIVLLLPLFIFSPGLIQFSHFGTTESLLLLFYTWIIYESLLFSKKIISLGHFLFIAPLLTGLAIATKASSILFIIVPLFVLLQQAKTHPEGARVQSVLVRLIVFLFITAAFSIVFSPHNLISFNDFLGTLRYETAVAVGKSQVFYTRQFAGTIPVLFQFQKIFPYTLGWPVLTFFLIGFFALPYRREFNILRISFLLYFLPNAFLFAKWTRFMAPVFPLMILFASLTLIRIYDLCLNTINKNFLLFSCYFSFLVISFSFAIPGIAFLSIYTNPDVRFIASSWINKNIPSDSYILSETANVVDLPVGKLHDYRYVSFDFYNLDTDKKLQGELKEHLKKADYIFIPSRRIIANHPQYKYPKLNDYYKKLFSGEAGFKKVAEFSSVFFPDENAEETFTVFDHPMIRIYKKVEPLAN